MERLTPTPAAQRGYDELAEALADRGVVASSLFGSPTLKVNKKAFAGLRGDAVSFRLVAGTSEHGEALALDGAALLDPSGMGRPMKDWVLVPVAHSGKWLGYADAAISRLG